MFHQLKLQVNKGNSHPPRTLPYPTHHEIHEDSHNSFNMEKGLFEYIFQVGGAGKHPIPDNSTFHAEKR